jgi:type II secretory pathway pseudopilin PulG
MKNKELGFGIIEVLISAMIIVMIVGSAIGLSREILKSNILASERVTAYNLAREELELARAARDTAGIDTDVNAWDVYLNCGENNECYLTKDVNNTDRWIYKTGNEIKDIDGIKYNRSFKISKIPAGESINTINELADPENANGYNLRDDIWVIKSEVTWNGHTVSASSIFTNWKPQV